jgi:hypothetical protein
MNIYFTASVVGKTQHLDNYLAIIDAVKKKGHTIIADHILSVTEQEINLKSEKERLNFHKKLEKWIETCDFVIVEASFPSISVGYEVSLALQRGKPVLLLYAEGHPPSLFAYHENERLVCQKYTASTVSQIIDEFIDYVEGTSDTRFTFFITPAISSHLEKMSKKHRIPKSVYLRQLIEDDIKNHK